MRAAPVARRSGLAFTIVVSVVMFVGACLMALVLLVSSAPGALVVGVVLAARPVAPLIACFVWLDRYEPEPRSLLLLGLGWGAFVASSSALVLQIAGEFAFEAPRSFSGAVVAPLTEEAAKGLFILLLLWFRRNELDGILDGIVYAGMVGGIAVGSRKPAVRFFAPLVGFLLAVGAHAAWNGSIFLGGGKSFVLTYLFVMVPGFFLIVGFAIWARRRESVLLAEALTDCAKRGFIDPAEIPWLVRLPARREARRNAEAVGGREARSTMAAYQQQAIELGFLHSRFLRGTAPHDFAQRGQYFVDTMRELRPGVVWPSIAGGRAATFAMPAGGGQ